MMTWSLVPVGGRAVGPTLVAMVTMVGLRTPAGVSMSMRMGMSRTGATAAATSPTTSPGYRGCNVEGLAWVVPRIVVVGRCK
jgi:hypothetical protein